MPSQYLERDPMQSTSIVYNTGPGTYAALANSERLLIWACRIWVASVGAGRCPLCPIEHEFDRLGIADAASALHALMCATATSATRAFEVHGPGCQHLSRDEIRLMRAVAAAQQGDLDPALTHLQEWLPPAQADLALSPLRALGLFLRSAGLNFPIRTNNSLFESGTVCPADFPPTSTTLH
jgi:hypothetical protein